jgi:hypothetical protein
LAAKVASNKSVDGYMMACNDKADGRTQRKNKPMTGESKAGIGGGSDGNIDGSSGGGGG